MLLASDTGYGTLSAYAKFRTMKPGMVSSPAIRRKAYATRLFCNGSKRCKDITKKINKESKHAHIIMHTQGEGYFYSATTRQNSGISFHVLQQQPHPQFRGLH